MKKMISMLLVLAVLMTAVYAAAQDNVLSADQMEAAELVQGEMIEEEMAGEGDEEVVSLYGEIIEIDEAYVVLNSPEFGYVQVNLSEDTVIEGVEALEVGQTAVVMYNGMMTRSLPAQIHALHIGVYAVSGVIAEVLEDSIVIVQEETGEQIVITLPQPELAGENEELLDEEISSEEMEEEVLEEEASDAEADEESEEPETAEELEEIEHEDAEIESVYNVGDAVTVYTTGAMTMSLPPMMNALAIVFEGEATPGEAQEETAELDEAAEEAEETEESIG